MNFFKTFLASLTAIFVTVVFLVIVMFGIIISAVSGAGGKSEVTVADNSILKISLTAPIVENNPSNPDDLPFDFGELFPGGPSMSKLGLYQIVQSIRKAKDDDRIRGIYLTPGFGVQTGFSSLRTIHEALAEFKASGKFIYAYAEVYTEKTLYLASLADVVLMPETGFVEFNGLTSTPMYYKGLFEKLGLEPVIYKVGTHKSAVEPYIRKDMSEQNRQQVSEFLGTIWKAYSEDMANARGGEPSEYDNIANDLVIGDGSQAKHAGLVDELGYEEAAFTYMRDKLDLDEEKELKFITFKKYLKTPDLNKKSAKDRVAVIFAEGQITSGKSQDGSMGSETIIKAMRKARKDKNVKAVVLRVNSPGGSALASEMMTQELMLLKAEKPVICSMGDVAASGGYYIAAKCDKIYAEENTITGSIGIFGMSMYTGDMFEDKLGLTFDHVETHEHADFGNPNFKYTDVEDAMMQEMINRGYSNFLKVVQEGRSAFFADSAAVDQVAQGRVWSGAKAKELKLVDEIGGLDEAIAAAAEAANLDGYRMNLLPKPKSPMDQMIESLGVVQASSHPLREEIKMLEKIKRTIPQNGIYMMMPYTFDIK